MCVNSISTSPRCPNTHQKHPEKRTQTPRRRNVPTATPTHGMKQVHPMGQ